MAVPPFTRAESVLLLQARADGLAAADADRVAAALSDVPLDVAAAGATLAAAGLGADAFLTAVAEASERGDRRGAERCSRGGRSGCTAGAPQPASRRRGGRRTANGHA